MELRPLGRTGVSVSALGAGINLIDPGDVYSQGESEEIVGQAVREHRDEVVIATKVSRPFGGSRAPSRDRCAGSVRTTSTSARCTAGTRRSIWTSRSARSPI